MDFTITAMVRTATRRTCWSCGQAAVARVVVTSPGAPDTCTALCAPCTSLDVLDRLTAAGAVV